MTRIARLRIEVRTTTRLVLRVVEISTRTTLPTVARIIRAARGWYKNRAFKFAAGDTVWTSTRSRQGGDHRPASNRQFLEVLEKGPAFEFTHDIGRNRKLTILVEDVHESAEPETAYPRMTDAVGTLTVNDLTPEDSYYWIIEERGNPPELPAEPPDRTLQRRESARGARLYVPVGECGTDPHAPTGTAQKPPA